MGNFFYETCGFMYYRLCISREELRCYNTSGVKKEKPLSDEFFHEGDSFFFLLQSFNIDFVRKWLGSFFLPSVRPPNKTDSFDFFSVKHCILLQLVSYA